MSHPESPPSPTPDEQAEQEPLVLTDYEQSIEWLIALIQPEPEKGRPRPRSQPNYCAITWAPDEPQRISDISEAQIYPTGALRTRRWGQFYSAQAMIVEVSGATGDQQRHFVWCPIPPHTPGRPINIDPATLGAHGYVELSSRGVIEALKNRASSAEDYVTLLRALKAHDVQVPLGLVSSVNQYFWALSRSDYAQGEGSQAAANRQTTINLLQACKELGGRLYANAQSYLAGQLLRLIDAQPSQPGTTAAADRAAATLQACLEGAIIDNSPHSSVMHRILTFSSIYRYPFATDQLNQAFNGIYNNRSPINIFGRERVLFASEYICNILLGRHESPAQETVAAVVGQYASRPSAHSPERFFAAMNTVLASFGIDNLQVKGFTDVVPAFEGMLQAMHGALTTQDELAVLNLQRILKPVVMRAVTNTVLSAEVVAMYRTSPPPSSLPSDDPLFDLIEDWE